jgi:poly(3-hydroxybutyrate) depolymerase
LDLCCGIPAARKSRFECPAVGHYGIFNGSRFRLEIAPRVAAFVRAHDARGAREPVVLATSTTASADKSPARRGSMLMPALADAA